METKDQFVLIDISEGKVINLTIGEVTKHMVAVNGRSIFDTEKEALDAACRAECDSVAICHRKVTPWEFAGQFLTSNKEEFIQ